MPYQFDISGTLRQVSEEEWESSGDTGFVVVFDYGTTVDNKPYWLYIAVKPSKYKEFLHMSARRATIHYKEYGTILCYGFDRYVPEDVCKEMKEKYDSDSGYKHWLEADIDRARQDFLKTKSAEETIRFTELAAMLKKQQAE